MHAVVAKITLWCKNLVLQEQLQDQLFPPNYLVGLDIVNLDDEYFMIIHSPIIMMMTIVDGL